MKFRMDTTLRFWVDCSYEDRKYENANRTRAELIAEILREYERSGDAMRYLNSNGQIAWKASPWMLQPGRRRARGRRRFGGLALMPRAPGENSSETLEMRTPDDVFVARSIA